MEVKEGNKLIAEFMGYEWTGEYWKHPEPSMNVTYLTYDYSWDWLMPAFSKLFILFHKLDRKNEREWNEAFGFVDNFNTHANHNNISGAFETMTEALEWHLTQSPASAGE